jgi:hypothetical protein
MLGRTRVSHSLPRRRRRVPANALVCMLLSCATFLCISEAGAAVVPAQEAFRFDLSGTCSAHVVLTKSHLPCDNRRLNLDCRVESLQRVRVYARARRVASECLGIPRPRRRSLNPEHEFGGLVASRRKRATGTSRSLWVFLVPIPVGGRSVSVRPVQAEVYRVS